VGLEKRSQFIWRGKIKNFNRYRYMCGFHGCSYMSFNNSDIVIHERKHTGERPFICSYCNKRFASNYGKNRHQFSCLALKENISDLNAV